jgi:twitching motility protein PilU
MGKSRELGMCTFDQALFQLYEQRAIGFEEAIRNADSANELRLNIKLRSKRGEPSALGDAGGLSLDMGDDDDNGVDAVEELRRKNEARHKAEDEEMARLREKRRLAEAASGGGR